MLTQLIAKRFRVHVLSSAALLVLTGLASAATITTFSVPNASRGTVPESLNDRGQAVGYWTDGNNMVHGFVRSPGGAFTTFDAPNAGTGPGQGTYAYSINNAGEIAGYSIDSTGQLYGLLRGRTGAIILFEASSDTGSGHGTAGLDINDAGEVGGYYKDDNSAYHGFVRSPNGAIATFDAPGAGTSYDLGTQPVAGSGLNSSGALAGVTYNQHAVPVGFFRALDGTIAEFEVPGAVLAPAGGTLPWGFNALGDIVGVYTDSDYAVQGFLRSADGTYTNINVPGFFDTVPYAINASGAICGRYEGSGVLFHGFVRSASGVYTEFDAPGVKTDADSGTYPVSINAYGETAGFYSDAATGVYQGFVRTP